MEKKTPKRQGTAFWLADQDGALLRTLAAVEDRTYQAILGRALRAYAEASPDYQQRSADPPVIDPGERGAVKTGAPTVPEKPPPAVAEPRLQIRRRGHRKSADG
jgi:hypothetical protein